MPEGLYLLFSQTQAQEVTSQPASSVSYQEDSLPAWRPSDLVTKSCPTARAQWTVAHRLFPLFDGILQGQSTAWVPSSFSRVFPTRGSNRSSDLGLCSAGGLSHGVFPVLPVSPQMPLASSFPLHQPGYRSEKHLVWLC